MSSDQNPLELHVSYDRRRPVVRITGEVDLRTSPSLRDQLLKLVETEPERMIIDLSGVSYIDSSGVGTLVELKRRIARRGGDVVLAGLQPRVRSVFEITKLDSFFTIAADVDEARQG